nr:putative Gag-polypeptide of LTR copia-type [Tanacetum cinerariifolium]
LLFYLCLFITVGPSNSEDLISSIDLGNPLHLQNSDFSSNTIISVKLTGTENYRVWVGAIKLAINTRNKTGFIDGSCVKYAYANSSLLSNQWERCNSIMLSWLLNSASEDLFLGQIFSDNAIAVDNKKFGNTVNTSNNNGPNPNLLCKYCGKVGHTIDRCFDLIGYPPDYNKNSGLKQNGSKTFNVNSASTSNENCATLSFTNEQIMKLMNLINEVPSGSMQANMAGFASQQNLRDCEDNIATSMGENTSFKGIVPSSSSLNAQDLLENGSYVQPVVRRSCRQSKMPPKFNYYVVGSNVKYGLEMYVSYVNLNSSNYCLSTTLNKSSEPSTYYEAIKNTKWIETINNEIESLNRNNNWSICDLPKGRKPVGTAKHVDTPLPGNTTLNHIESSDDKLISDIGLLPVVLYYDNSSALQIAANSIFHEKSKHFEIDVHLIREKVASGVIKTENIHTTRQIGI